MTSPLPTPESARLVRRVEKLDEDSRSLSDTVSLIDEKVTAHTATLADHTATLADHTQRLSDIEMKVDSVEERLVSLRLHQLETNTNLRRVDGKVNKQGEVMKRHGEDLAEIQQTVVQHTGMLEEILRRLPA